MKNFQILKKKIHFLFYLFSIWFISISSYNFIKSMKPYIARSKIFSLLGWASNLGPFSYFGPGVDCASPAQLIIISRTLINRNLIMIMARRCLRRLLAKKFVLSEIFELKDLRRLVKDREFAQEFRRPVGNGERRRIFRSA